MRTKSISTFARFATTSLFVMLAGCAVNHSDNFVSLLITKEVTTPPSPIRDMLIILRQDRFADSTTKGKLDPGLATEAQRNVRTLFAALVVQLPATFVRNGIEARVIQVPKEGESAEASGYILTLRPTQAGSTPGKPVEVTLGGELHDPSGRLVWRGTALERVSERSERQLEMAKWSDAMAEDLARTLLGRWSRDGLIKLGSNGSAEPI